MSLPIDIKKIWKFKYKMIFFPIFLMTEIAVAHYNVKFEDN